MPAGRVYRKKRRMPLRRRKKVAHKKKYRRNVATIARPLNVKPRTAIQKVTYYQSFNCNPALDTSQPSGQQQQNYAIKLALNSLWPFENNWDIRCTGNGRTITPNDPITPYAQPVTDGMTIMPNVRDGANLFEQYNNCCVIGTKVTAVATPIANTADNQLGYMYGIIHSQASSGLGDSASITDLNKMPYRKMVKVQGSGVPTSGFQTNNIVGGKLVFKHSPKRFNNIKDYRDNKGLFCTTGSNTVASSPNEGDYLTIGIVPALNFRDLQCTKFGLQLRIEQTLLWTEPLESLATGAGNYSFPWNAKASRFFGGVGAAGIAGMLAY